MSDRQKRRALPQYVEENGCCEGHDCSDMSRRRFIQVAGVGAAAVSTVAGPISLTSAAQKNPLAGHFVPADKGLAPDWKKQLFAKGEPTVYRGKDLEKIGMPIGGVCAGQLYLAGDGRLRHWNLFNQRNFTGYGRDNYSQGYAPDSPVDQGFAVRVSSRGKTETRTLDSRGFPQVTFCGEYPIGMVDYADASFPIAVRMEAYSPFIPLDAERSTLPATMFEFTVKNTSEAEVEVTLAGWLENAVSLVSAEQLQGHRKNRLVDRDDFMMVVGESRGVALPKQARAPHTLADFEGSKYGEWTAEGEALGTGPAQGTLEGQNKVSGFQGKGLVNTFFRGDQTRGKLTSPEFTIDRAYLCMLVGGGRNRKNTCVNLLVDGKPVRTATGRNSEELQWTSWNVEKFQGKQATLEIVDTATGPWGHVNVDQIELCDAPKSGRKGRLEDQEDFGTMGLAVVGKPRGAAGKSRKTVGATALRETAPVKLFTESGKLDSVAGAEKPLDEKLVGAVGRTFSLPPGESTRLSFALAWSFPKRPDQGETNYYAKRFPTATAVVEYLADNLPELSRQTRLWHDTWYDSTLPYWLLDRLFSTTSILATGTCYWWGNGRFWGWEGVGCCAGTCAHVWNYEHAMARLFPELERSVRERQDFGAGFVPSTGEIHFRGESNDFWAGDGSAGTILKCLREHQMSKDDQFVRRNWPRIRKALEFLIGQDSDDNGVLEGSQHNTYDINFFGPNTMVGSLYLGALRAGAEMARVVGDDRFAAKCQTLFEKGSEKTVSQLFNGEFFIQDVDLTKHPKFQYGGGCLSDQLFGQGWAHQVGLGYLYPKEAVLKTLESVWKYNWAPDVGPQNVHFKPERVFASPGEPGLFTCTWPNNDRMPNAMRYRNEIWTGIEYQVAGHMAWEGMITEALAICRGVHDRYHPAKRNPWNEVECGDHYSRAMASHGVFLGLCGFECDGPRAHLGFAPRITPEGFRASFTSAEGWGSIEQKRDGKVQTQRIEVKWGKAPVKTLAFELPEGAKLAHTTVTLNGKRLAGAKAQQEGGRVTITLAKELTIGENQALEVQMTQGA